MFRLPTSIFHSQGVKANVLFFDARPRGEEAVAKALWIYDFRTSERFTLRLDPLTRHKLQDFVDCYKCGARQARNETERFKRFAYADLAKSERLNLDIFWLKDDSLEDSAGLPPPDLIAAEIVENLEAALTQFRSVALALGSDVEIEEVEPVSAAGG